MGFVGYRDYCCEDDRITSFDLSSEFDSFFDFVESLETDWGSDFCEDVFGGLEAVAGLKWTMPIRNLIHIGDAPQHGTR